MLEPGLKTFPKIEKASVLNKAFEIGADEIISEIKKSKIRGKGGGGFPTGLKWSNAREQESDIKYVICNADEGEPGTFKDREILLNTPDLMFEGMTVCGYVIGASKGYLYLRGEYTFMRENLEKILQARRDEGLLGENIRDGFSFDIEIRMGAGAYICGEQSALVESIEGKAGYPREKFPLLTESGLWGKPTVVNNVETFGWIASIILHSADWFIPHGSSTSTGPKLYSISGDTDKAGLYEYRSGCTVKELFDEIGIDCSNIQAVQVSGAAGECIPVDMLDQRVMGYEDVFSGGSIMIFDKSRNMVEIIENFLEFFLHETCGQCVTCPLGCKKMLACVRAIKDNEDISEERLKDVMDMVDMMRDQNLNRCGLGQIAPNPFVNLIEHFYKK